MKAILCKTHGKPDALVFEDIPTPSVSAGKILIQVMACGVTFPDTLIIQNLYQFKPALPFSPGGEVSGIVKAVGEGVKNFKVDDHVFALAGWGGYAEELLIDAKRCFPTLPNMDFVTAASVMYNYGTSYHALKDRAVLQKGETLLVMGAAGGVGLAAVELGKLMGARVVGIAGGAKKCAFAIEALGFDACIDHKSAEFAQMLQTATPKGIDVYFENVGGAVFDAVVPLLNTGARIPVCGLVSQYNATALPAGPDRLSWLMGQVLRKRLTLRGFIIFQDFGHLYDDFAKQMTEWIAAGRMHYVEEIIDGLEHAPHAFIGLLRGENFGKRVIRVGNPAYNIHNRQERAT